MKAHELLQQIHQAKLSVAGKPMFSAMISKPDPAWQWARDNRCEIPSERWLAANPDAELSEFAAQHPILSPA